MKKKHKKKKWDFLEPREAADIIPTTASGVAREENKVMDENGQNDSFDFDLKEEDCAATSDDNNLNKSRVIVSQYGPSRELSFHN